MLSTAIEYTIYYTQCYNFGTTHYCWLLLLGTNKRKIQYLASRWAPACCRIRRSADNRRLARTAANARRPSAAWNTANSWSLGCRTGRTPSPRDRWPTVARTVPRRRRPPVILAVYNTYKTESVYDDNNINITRYPLKTIIQCYVLVCLFMILRLSE